MRYLGSKKRYVNEILPIILKDRTKNQWYVEPFIGGCNVIERVNGNRIGNDLHFYLVELFKAIQNGWNPPEEISKELYKEIEKNPENFPPNLVGFVGFGASYAGKWWGGYAKVTGAHGKPRSFAAENKRILLKQYPNIKDIIFKNENYLNLEIPKNSIIYCDPPYKNTVKYYYTFTENFNHDEFWEWCRNKSKEGHEIFISEYEAPEDFECVWRKEVKNRLHLQNHNIEVIEKLFTYKS